MADANGIAVLRGIHSKNDIRDVYVQHPGLGLGYDWIRWCPGDPPAIIDCGYAPARTGRGRSLGVMAGDAPHLRRRANGA